MNMQFNVPVVKKCLVDSHEVYTVRSYRSYNKFRVVEVDGIEYISERMHVVECKEDLEDFVKLSGFKNALDWWNKIRSFRAVGGYMYHVYLSQPVFENKRSDHTMNHKIDNDNKVIVTFTGNRSIAASNPTMIESLVDVHKRYPNAIWRSGMAYGVDLSVAQFAYTHKIPFEAHLPFPAYIQTKMWKGAAVDTHTMLLTKAVKVFTYAQEFLMGAYQVRNEKMAEGADVVVAFNLHEKGGTANMIWYCLSKNIEVLDGFDSLKVMSDVV